MATPQSETPTKVSKWKRQGRGSVTGNTAVLYEHKDKDWILYLRTHLLAVSPPGYEYRFTCQTSCHTGEVWGQLEYEGGVSACANSIQAF